MSATELIRAAQEGNANAVRTLLAEGKDINAKTARGQTPLILASFFGHGEVVRVLLEAGADVGTKDSLGLTAMEWSMRRGFYDVSQLFQVRSQHDAVSREAEEKARREAEERHRIAEQAEREAEEVARKQAQEEVRIRTEQERGKAEAERREAEQLAKRKAEAETQRKAELRKQEEEEQKRIRGERERKKAEEARREAEQLAKRKAEAETQRKAELRKQEEEARKKLEENKRSEKEEPRIREDEKHGETSRPVVTLGSTASQLVKDSQIKRCPKCNRLYRNDIQAYCPYDAARLVGDDDLSFTVSTKPDSSAWLKFWGVVLITLVASVVFGYLVNKYTSRQPPAATVIVEPPKPAVVEENEPVIEGPLNGKETAVPKPDYPARARTEGVSGKVTVAVRVNKNGKVVSARALDGHPLLKRAAIQAARKARFAPEKLADQRSRISGTITYNFRF